MSLSETNPHSFSLIFKKTWRRERDKQMKKKLFLLLCFFFLCHSVQNAEGGRGGRGARPAISGTFDVRHFGARGNGRNDDSKAFMAAWQAACSSSGYVKVVIPRGTYLAGPVKFLGPCRNVQSMTVYMQGYVKASTDLNQYVQGDDWFEFAWVDRLTLTGGGTFDGQGAASWPYNQCPMNMNCKVLPTSVKFVATTNTVVKDISSVNSKFFHIALVGCQNFWGSHIRITAPGNSPNTDGIHIDRCTGVTLYSSVIGTGDDCISIGHSNSQLLISGITCGPGHGISVGSLGRYNSEGDVQGLIIRDCTLTKTMFGVRIKTWANSPGKSSAKNMTFQNIVMNNVGNPIYIDQMYCPYSSCANQSPSKVKISDITFRNIRGTSTTPTAVTLKCSRGVPCQNINLHDVHLKYTGREPSSSTCLNVRASYSGTQIPPPCR